MILSLHHVTATVNDAQDDLDFCRDGLGLRLVKRTVNFDNHHVHHFYYGDERGTPGTIWTTFPYKDRGVKVGTKGAGQVTVSAFSVPAGSLPRWKARLLARGLAVSDIEPRFGEEALRFSDRSGLDFELIATARDARTPWSAGGIPEPDAIRGPKEGLAPRPHLTRAHGEHNGPAMALPDLAGRGRIGRQVHMLAAAGLQALGADCVDAGCSSAMKQDGRWLGGLQSEVDLDRMALVSPDAPARSVERKPLLVARRDDLEDRLARQRHAVCPGPRDQFVDIGPALLVEHKADALRLMPQHQAQEFAHPDRILRHTVSG